MERKTFQVEYTVVPESEQTYDISFELSEDAEEALFSGIAKKLHDSAEIGGFNGELIHLYKRLADQQQPPWVELDGKRTYDLELTVSEYSLLTDIIGMQMTNVLRPEAAETYEELLGVWQDMTQTMLDEPEDGVEDMADIVADAMEE